MPGDITIVVPGPGEGEKLIDDRNEHSLSYGSEIKKNERALQQETLLTVQGLVSDVMYKWCYTTEEAFKGAEKGGLCHPGWQIYPRNRANTSGATEHSSASCTQPTRVQAPL